MYVLKLALRPWRQAWVSQITSVFSVGFLIFACTLLVWLERGLNPVIHRLRAEQVMTAYLVPTLPKKDEPAVRDAIRVAMGAGAERADVKLTTGDEFLAQLKESYPQLATELADVRSAIPADSDPILPRYVTVSGVLAADIGDKIRGISGVESVETSAGRFRPVAGAFRTVQWLARFLAIGLLLALLNSLIHLARAHASFHSQTFSILSLWGADRTHARMPCALSGFSVGLLGGMGAAIAWLVVAPILRTRIQMLSPALTELPDASFLLALGASAAGALLGMGCGLLGASTRTTVRGG